MVAMMEETTIQKGRNKMVNCPKCKTENFDDAINCKSCHINLAFALSHPEQVGAENIQEQRGDVGESKARDVMRSSGEVRMLDRISPALFGIALLLFLLPWVQLSCQGHPVGTLSGYQLVAGTTIEGQKTKGEALAVIALLSTVAGVFLSLSNNKMKHLIVIGASGLGVIMLLALKLKLDGDILRQGQGALQLSYGAGYYLTLLSLLSVIGVNGYYKYAGGKQGFLSQTVTGGSSYKFCSECGSKNLTSNAFCSDCGAKFN